jgi:hypothetical protein
MMNTFGIDRFLAGVVTGALVVVTACSPSAPPAPSPKAAVQHVHYEDGHIRFVEYALAPGANAIEAVAYPSVLMADAPWPSVTEAPGSDSSKTRAETSSDTVFPFDNRPYPYCRVESPRAARVVTVDGDFPQHYYRVEYKRVDGKDYPANWKAWYSDVFAPPAQVVPDPGLSLKDNERYSKEWPFNIGYSSTTAAPANHTVRYQDEHVELIEVAIRPGETENMHGHPYPSVYADDGGFSPAGASYKNRSMVKDFTVPWGKLTSPFDAGIYPICFSAIPEPPHQVSVNAGPPQHFYRVHFKRVDGDDVKTRWRSWYPAP